MNTVLACAGCNAPLSYRPGESIACPYCGLADPTGSNVSKYTKTCDRCGASVSLVDRASLACPFCGSPVHDTTAEIACYDGIVPFSLSRDDAVRKFREWVNGRLLAPSDLHNHATIETLDGYYFPYRFFSSSMHVDFTAEVQRLGDENGNRGTLWDTHSDTFETMVRDVPVCCSTHVHDVIRTVETFDFSGIESYDALYTTGWSTLAPNVPDDILVRDFEIKALALAKPTALHRLESKNYRDLTLDATHRDTTSRNLLVPFYFVAFSYSGQRYHVYVNSQSGQVGGERPYSWMKFGLLALGIITTILVILPYLSRTING